MENQNIGEKSSKRIVVVDSLRGFALFGIMMSHMSCLFYSYDLQFSTIKNPPIGDIIVNFINGNFISGKFFAIFSFLFGLSYFIQMDRAAQKGINYQWRFLWRLIILLVIGLIHGLLFSGDILIIYAILGIPLILLYKVKDKVLVALMVILLLGAPRFITYGIEHIHPNTTAIKVNNQAMGIYQNGSFYDIVKVNAVDQLINKAKYQTGVEGRAYLSLAMFLLGLLVGRKRYFERIEENLPMTRKIFKWSILFALGFRLISFGLFALSKKNEKEFSFQIAETFLNLYSITFALLITTGFIILYQNINIQRFFNKLIPYGKMGMTNYIMQSVIAVPLLYGFGLGLTRHINLTIGIGMGIVIYYIQIQYSKWWLNHFIYGPFEWVWRSLTWLKWQPLKKNKDPQINQRAIKAA